jgi:DNA-directed RNA polymerase alpha subunit
MADQEIVLPESILLPKGFSLDSDLTIELNLNLCAIGAMRNCGISTVWELASTKRRLLTLPGFGGKSLRQIKDQMCLYGFDMQDFMQATDWIPVDSDGQG